MKLNERLMFGLILAFAMASTAEAGIFDFLFGSDEEAEAEQPVEVEAPQGAGLFLDDSEYSLGKAGFECLQDLAGVENPQGWGDNLMGPIARVMLAAYGETGIQTICDSRLLARMRSQKAAGRAQTGNRRLRREQHYHNNNITTSDRQLGSCSSWPAHYAGSATESGAGSIYDDFARKHLDEYLSSSDRTQRSNAVRTFSLQDQVTTVRRAQQVFSRCTQLWSTINKFVAAPDVPGINQEAVSEAFQSFVCDLPGTYSDIAAMRLQRDQELIQFHNELVNGAEVGAMYRNTRTLMDELCERDSRMTTVMEEIQAIKETVHRM